MKLTWIQLALPVSFFICGLLSLSSYAATQEQPSKKPQPKSESADKPTPDPTDLLRGALTYIRDAKTLSFKSVCTMKIADKGRTHKIIYESRIALEKPNKFNVFDKGNPEVGLPSRNVVSDGTKLYHSLPDQKEYAVHIASMHFEAMGGGLGEASGAKALLEVVNGNKSVEQDLKETKAQKYVGKEDLDGTLCHHIQFKDVEDGEETDTDMWIEAGEKPLIRRAIPRVDAGDEVVVNFTDWKANEPLPPDAFKFAPPEGSKKVDQLSKPPTS